MTEWKIALNCTINQFIQYIIILLTDKINKKYSIVITFVLRNIYKFQMEAILLSEIK